MRSFSEPLPTPYQPPSNPYQPNPVGTRKPLKYNGKVWKFQLSASNRLPTVQTIDFVDCQPLSATPYNYVIGPLERRPRSYVVARETCAAGSDFLEH